MPCSGSHVHATHAQQSQGLIAGTEQGENTWKARCWHQHGEMEELSQCPAFFPGPSAESEPCLGILIKAKTKQECGSVPVPTRKEQFAVPASSQVG